MQRRPPGALSSVEVLKATGVSYRQLDYWARTRRITPSLGDAGESGMYRWWSEADVEKICRVKERMDWGMTLDAALRRVDPPLPPPYAPSAF